MQPVSQVIAATRGGDLHAVSGLYTADAVVVDEMAPFHWTGKNAGRSWLAAVGKFIAASKMTNFNLKASPPAEVQQAGSSAYVVVPILLTGLSGGKHVSETGFFTFALRKIGGSWMISNQVWTTRALTMT